jgi:hypothetical protein
VTEYSEVILVPQYDDVDAGPASGSPGEYEVVFALGVPGLSGVTMSLTLDPNRAPGDSLLEGTGLEIRFTPIDGSPSRIARIVPNVDGRLAQVRMTVPAENFKAAETAAYDVIMPVLSRIAFEADTPLEATAVMITEVSTQILFGGTTFLGLAQPAPQQIAGSSTPEIRSYLAAYREGLNSNSPLYQVLSYYKVVEGAETFGKNRARAAAKAGDPVLPDALDFHQIPSDLNSFSNLPPGAVQPTAKYVGLTFREVRDKIEDTIRNAVVHLTPGRDVRVADYLADIQACREIAPVLRYMARTLIQQELALLPPALPASATTS